MNNQTAKPISIEAEIKRVLQDMGTEANISDGLFDTDDIAARISTDRRVIAAFATKSFRSAASSDNTMELVRKRIEDELISMRDSGMFMMRRNGFAVHDKDSRPNGVIRLSTEMGVSTALNYIADLMEQQYLSEGS